MSKKNRKTRLGRVLEKRKRENTGESSDDENNSETEVHLEPSRVSDEPLPKKTKWINRQRVLVFAARGTTQRDRHLMNDLKSIMPHSRPENKISRREHLTVINELCKMKNCNKSMFFEGRKQQDLYMWISNVPEGPSAKFLIESIFTMNELRLSGNCLKGSRPLLSFDQNFEKEPHYALLKELFIQVFGVPNRHPKSQPFIDRVVSFTILDNRIWYRHYQILKEDGALAEIGPRFVFNPIKIFEESFTGKTLWDNPHYVTPNKYRKRLSVIAGQKYVDRHNQRLSYKMSRPSVSYPSLPEDDVFEGDTLEKASKIANEPLPIDTNDPEGKELVKKKLLPRTQFVSFKKKTNRRKNRKNIAATTNE